MRHKSYPRSIIYSNSSYIGCSLGFAIVQQIYGYEDMGSLESLKPKTYDYTSNLLACDEHERSN